MLFLAHYLAQQTKNAKIKGSQKYGFYSNNAIITIFRINRRP